MESRPGRLRRGWQRPDHDVGAGRDLGEQLEGNCLQSASHGVPDRRRADSLAHDEAEARLHLTGCDANVRQGVRCGEPGPAPHDRPVVVRPDDAVGLGEHRERGATRRARCGPCGDARPGWRGRRGCACGGGSRAPWRGGGCSAGRYASSWFVSRSMHRPRRRFTNELASRKGSSRRTGCSQPINCTGRKLVVQTEAGKALPTRANDYGDTFLKRHARHAETRAFYAPIGICPQAPLSLPWHSQLSPGPSGQPDGPCVFLRRWRG